MTPIPNKVADPKDAVLWAVLHKMETIDENTSSRLAFGNGILYNAYYNSDKPVFEEELAEIRKILGLPKVVEEEKQEIVARSMDAPSTEVTMREL